MVFRVINSPLEGKWLPGYTKTERSCTKGFVNQNAQGGCHSSLITLTNCCFKLARRIKYRVDTLITAMKPIYFFTRLCCARHGQKRETATREAIYVSSSTAQVYLISSLPIFFFFFGVCVCADDRQIGYVLVGLRNYVAVSFFLPVSFSEKPREKKQQHRGIRYQLYPFVLV